MRRFVFAVACCFLSAGCDAGDSPAKIVGRYNYEIMNTSGIQEIDIDGCQYLVAQKSSYGIAMIHKANCKNPEHKEPTP